MSPRYDINLSIQIEPEPIDIEMIKFQLDMISIDRDNSITIDISSYLGMQMNSIHVLYINGDEGWKSPLRSSANDKGYQSLKSYTLCHPF